MIATTISNSMSEKPFCFRISFYPSPSKFVFNEPLPTIRTLRTRMGVTKEVRNHGTSDSFFWVRVFHQNVVLAEQPPIPHSCVTFCRRVTNFVRLQPGDPDSFPR
jgi:hypothetical protein